MAGYEYGQGTRESWSPLAQATLLWEQLQNANHNAEYWERRARSAERRMQEHQCQEGTE